MLSAIMETEAAITLSTFIVNFDETVPFSSTKKLLDAVSGVYTNTDFGEERQLRFEIKTASPCIYNIDEVSEEWAKEKFDLAILLVHANESRLNINEPGFGYHKAYEALQGCSGDHVINIVGGDQFGDSMDNSRFYSSWVEKKIACQFDDEYLDGRKGLLLSWNETFKSQHVGIVAQFALPKYTRADGIVPELEKSNPEDEETRVLSVVDSEHIKAVEEQPGKVSVFTQVSKPPKEKKDSEACCLCFGGCWGGDNTDD